MVTGLHHNVKGGTFAFATVHSHGPAKVWQMSGVDSAQAETLVNEWLRRCPIYNTLKRATDITVMIDGEAMAMAGQ